MSKELEIRVSPADRDRVELHRKLIAKELRLGEGELGEIRLLRRSLDARHNKLMYMLRFQAGLRSEVLPAPIHELKLENVAAREPVIIIGAGPAGLFAALRSIELGLRPVILERGKPVRERRRDIAALTKQGVVDPDSNYCFGEGGAGTFSDGKLYTRSQKRGSIERILGILYRHGADEDVLIDAHPHIGTNRLPAVVQAIRETILSCGGEIHFGQRASELIRDSSGIRGVRTITNEVFQARAAVVASGHSARDIFRMFAAAGLALERKPFAIGVRAEHAQSLIDEIQYGGSAAERCVPSAAYSVRAQASRRGVFSFCMCPGGIICPAATSSDEVVVNGWSPSKRNSRFANSGLVVEVPAEDLPGDSIFAGIEYQNSIERRAALVGGGRQVAPAQRLTDFVERRISQNLPDCSYLPGLAPANLHDVLPPELGERLVFAIRSFDKQLRGYLTHEALIVAPESRTSSPVRIPRDRETLMHPGGDGIFPCGEGAGYAGGIVSAAMDGERCAEAAARYLSGM